MPATDNLMAGLAGFAQGFGDVYKMGLKKDLEDVPIEQVEALTGKSFPGIARGSTVPKEMIPLLVRQQNPRSTTVIDRLTGKPQGTYPGDVRFSPASDQVEAYNPDGTPKVDENGDQVYVSKGARQFTAKTPTVPQTPEDKAAEAGLIETAKLKAQAAAGKLISPEDKANQLNQAKLDREKPKVVGSLNNTLHEYDNMINEANAIANDSSLGSGTGITSILGKIPATGAKRVSARIDTLKAKTLLNVLTALKSLSANGASGFGQLSDTEGKAIQSSVTTLDKTLSTKDFKDSLSRFIDEMNTRKGNLISTYKNTYGEDLPSPTSTTGFPVVQKTGFTSDGGPALSEPVLTKPKNRSAEDILNQYLKGK